MLTLEWGDGEYAFALYGKQIEELQTVCGNVGFGGIYKRVVMGDWFFSDIYHTVRLGLIGGGMGAVEAKRLVDMYIGKKPDEMPMAGPNSAEALAVAILSTVMFGFKDLPEKKKSEKDNPDGFIDFHEIRAGFARMNLDPTIVERMEIGAVFHMFHKMEKKDATDAPTEESYERMLENVRKMNMPDVVLN